MGLRIRLTVYYTGFFAVALLLLGMGLYFGMRQALLTSVATEMRRGAEQILMRYRIERDWRAVMRDNTLWITPPDVEGFDAPSMLVRALNADGQIVARSPSLNLLSIDLPELDPHLRAQVLAGETVTSIAPVGKTRLYSLLTPVESPPALGQPQIIGILQVAVILDEVDRTLSLLLLILLGGGMFVLVLGAGGGWLLARAAFRPIDQVTRTAQGIVGAEDLARRVPVPAAQDELQRLIVTINDLLGRLEALFAAQRRFLADVSHELRTPLAAMQGNLEVLQRGAARDPELLHESLTDMRQETGRLIRMVNDLLLLARTESGAGMPLRRESLELDSLLLEVHRELLPLVNGVQLRIGAIDQITVTGDRDRLKQALLNLAVNALQHTSANQQVVLGLRLVRDPPAEDEAAPPLPPPGPGSWVALEVSDTGVGIATEDLPHLFERFYRADPARRRIETGPLGRSSGAGLGLAIVRWVAEAHGGCVAVRSAPGVGSTFVIWLPGAHVQMATMSEKSNLSAFAPYDIVQA